MSTIKMLGLTSGLLFVWMSSAGCMSRDEYLREKFARTKATERAETLERDLADERNRVMALEAEREHMGRELEITRASADNYKSQNERLDEFNQRLQAELDELSGRQIGEIKVVEVKLPPELDQALKSFAAQYPDAVEYDANRGVVRWKSDLTFAKGSDAIRDDARASLAAFADIVNSGAAGAFEVVIVGHTDNLRIGPATGRKHPTNWHLSVHRSIAVKDVLASDGVGQERLGVMGYGEFRPAVPNPSSGGSEANRRVEIFLVGSHERIPNQTTALNPLVAE
jgi:chemotaxis protein MotB